MIVVSTLLSLRFSPPLAPTSKFLCQSGVRDHGIDSCAGLRVLRVRMTEFVPWRGSDHENLWKVMVRDVDLPVFVCADSSTHSHTRLARTSLATLSILNSRRWRCGMTEGSWWRFGHQSFSAVLQHFLLALRHRLRCLSLFPSKNMCLLAQLIYRKVFH